MEKDYKLYVLENPASITSDELERALALLPDWRREQALRFKHERGRIECAFSYLLLCQALRECFGIAAQPRFSIGQHGKPFLPDHPQVQFNLSHCRTAIACVVSDRPVGVDVERVGRFKDSLARYVLNDHEYAQLLAAPNPDLLFTRFWTQKEAIVKLTGRGIDDDLKNLLFTYKDVTLHTEEHPQQGYVLTVAFE